MREAGSEEIILDFRMVGFGFFIYRGSIPRQVPQMQGCTLPYARRQAAMTNRYSLLEWGIPKSTHPNNEIYGICKQ